MVSDRPGSSISVWKAQLISEFARSLYYPEPSGAPGRAFLREHASYELQPDVQAFSADLIARIRRASSRIDRQFYTFEADGCGRPVGEALMEAHLDRGVAVRLMVDDFINLMHNDRYIRVPRLNRQLQRSVVREWRETLRFLELMGRVGLDVRMTNPLGILQRKALLRNHKKLVVIDGDIPEMAVAYAGGINLSDHNAGWHDFMVKMAGDMVPLILDDLDRTWEGRNRGGIAEYDEGFILADAHRHSVIIPVAQYLVSRARERVVVESAYLWGRGTWRALAQAALRGVGGVWTSR